MPFDLTSLNPQQREAVTHRGAPLLVLAGAGSGKTRVVMYRVAWLLSRGVPGENILGVAFTNKSAGEMRDRLATLVPPAQARAVRLSTFHSLGANILREEIERLGYRRPFTILDESDRVRALRDVLRELRLSGTTVSEARLLSIISRAKNAGTSPARLAEARFDPAMPAAQKVFDLYNRALKNLNAVDFDDLLLLPWRLLSEHADLRLSYRQRWRHVLVDEYQDTNAIQLRLLQQLVAPPDQELTVVGDDDQSIYRFRGAVAGNILSFDDAFPGTRVIALEQNYRSVSSILDAANAVIAHNARRRPKRLWSELGRGEAVRLVELDSDALESEFVADEVARAREEEQRAWRDFAVLYRSNAQATVLEEAFRARRIPYRLIGGQSLFDRKEIKDLLSYLRLLLNPSDELALRRVINVPARGIGTASLEWLDAQARSRARSLWEIAETSCDAAALPDRARAGLASFTRAVSTARAALRAGKPDELQSALIAFLDEIGLESAVRAEHDNPKWAQERWSGLLSLLDGIEQCEGATAFGRLDHFIGRLALDTTSGRASERDENVATLLTIHSAKGLEFPVVHIVGMSEELLPHHHSMEESEGIAEERRLFYVAMTRARQRLVLTRSRNVLRRNERIPRKPSRFLAEIPAALLQRAPAAIDARAKQEREKQVDQGFDALLSLLGKS